MKIMVISDSHDNLENLRKAIKTANNKNVDLIIHCGDLISPFMIKEFSKFNGKVHFVWGNNDGDKAGIIKNKPDNVKIHGILGEINVDDKKIAFIHYDFLAIPLAATNRYDVVFFGHSHKKFKEKMGKTIVANPGELAEVFGKASYLIYDTKNDEISFYEL